MNGSGPFHSVFGSPIRRVTTARRAKKVPMLDASIRLAAKPTPASMQAAIARIQNPACCVGALLFSEACDTVAASRRREVERPGYLRRRHGPGVVEGAEIEGACHGTDATPSARGA